MSVAAAAAGVGMGLQAYGAIKGANAEVGAAKEEATFRELQAQQIMRAGVREEHLLRIREAKIKGSMITAFAGAGGELSGSNLLALEETAAQAAEEAAAIQLDARFNADQLRRSGAAGVELARKRRTAALLGTAGSILTQGTSVAMKGGLFDGNTFNSTNTAGYTSSQVGRTSILGFRPDYGIGG